MNLVTHPTEGIPEDTRIALQMLQENMVHVPANLESEQSLDMKTKEGIMKMTQSIDACTQFEESRDWERITSDLECLNGEIAMSDNLSFYL